ncbi:MAG: hypothetical protein CMN30_12490 [Sandaracinus sp.]|nr:hypothetical protein [Sandaracinus sp.]
MRRLYSEHVPLGEVQQPGLLRLLAERDVELAVALFPRDVAALRPLHEAVRRAGVRLVLWPLLPDALGRWPSGANGAAFADHVDALVAETEGAATVLFDVEPPIAWTRRALHGRAHGRPADHAGRHATLGPIADRLRAAGHRVEAVVPPMVPFGRRWERLLATPVSSLGCARVEPMAYTSLFEGYSKGTVDRRVARDLLGRLAERQPAALALGVVGGGALGDERAYRGIHELEEDVAIARAHGVERLSLYALDGILLRGAPEPWLDAFCRTPAAERLPARTRRGAALIGLARAIGRLG